MDAELRRVSREGRTAERVVAQLRAGDLHQETVELAAAAGCPVACRVLRREVVVIDSYAAAREAMRGMGSRQAVWLAVGAARLVVPIWEMEYPEDGRPQRATQAAEAWVLNPSEAKSAAAAAAAAAWSAAEEAEAGGRAAAAATAAAAAWSAEAWSAAWSAKAAGVAAVLPPSRAVLWSAEAGNWPEVQAAMIEQAWRLEEVIRGG